MAVFRVVFKGGAIATRDVSAELCRFDAVSNCMIMCNLVGGEEEIVFLVPMHEVGFITTLGAKVVRVRS